MEQNRVHIISNVTIGGAFANLVLTIFKLIAGTFGKSSAMIADAIHSLSDLISDIVILILVKVAAKGEDKNHNYGHGKFETLATVIVAVLLLVIGAHLMADGVEKIRIVAQGGELAIPGKIALWAAIISILIKEILFQWTSRVGKKVNSPAMITNAWHHRTDALSSIGAALGIGGAMLLGGKWAVLDPIVCCVISIFIIVIAVKMAMPALHELTEGALPHEMEKCIIDIINNVKGVDNVHALKTRRNGPTILIEAHIVVNPLMTVADAHNITIEVENALREEFGNETQIVLHVEPSVEAD